MKTNNMATRTTTSRCICILEGNCREKTANGLGTP